MLSYNVSGECVAAKPTANASSAPPIPTATTGQTGARSGANGVRGRGNRSDTQYRPVSATTYPSAVSRPAAPSTRPQPATIAKEMTPARLPASAGSVGAKRRTVRFHAAAPARAASSQKTRYDSIDRYPRYQPIRRFARQRAVRATLETTRLSFEET